MKLVKFFRILKKIRRIKPILRIILLCLVVLLTFFYSFWFSLSKDKIKNFITDKVFANQQLTIGSIKKKWCSVEISQLKIDKFFVEKAKINFCSFRVILLQSIPIVLQFEGGDVFIKFPILAARGNISIDPNFAWNQFPIISDYITLKDNPSYVFTAQYAIAQDLQVSAELSAKQFIIDKIKYPLIQSFLPKEIFFDDLNIKVDILAKNIVVKIKSQGIFQGDITGIIVRKKDFFQSKISFKISGILKNTDQLNLFVLAYIKPYLKDDVIKLKILGSFAAPRVEAF